MRPGRFDFADVYPEKIRHAEPRNIFEFGGYDAGRRTINSLNHGEFGQARQKGERRSVTSQAPPLLRQRKPYLTGSPPSQQERRCRQECRVIRL
jgi:hypothetical protein